MGRQHPVGRPRADRGGAAPCPRATYIRAVRVGQAPPRQADGGHRGRAIIGHWAMRRPHGPLNVRAYTPHPGLYGLAPRAHVPRATARLDGTGALACLCIRPGLGHNAPPPSARDGCGGTRSAVSGSRARRGGGSHLRVCPHRRPTPPRQCCLACPYVSFLHRIASAPVPLPCVPVPLPASRYSVPMRAARRAACF